MIEKKRKYGKTHPFGSVRVIFGPNCFAPDEIVHPSQFPLLKTEKKGWRVKVVVEKRKTPLLREPLSEK